MTSRRYAHIYYCHFERMSALGAEPHLNTCFKHFVYFVYEFNLIPNRTELSPLQELIDKLLERDQGSSQQRPPPSNSTTNNTTAASGASASTGAAPAVAAGGAVPVQQQAAASEPVSVE